MTGTTLGNHPNTRVFLVAFQLCIRNGCNQVVNNSVDKTDIAVARRTSYASFATPTLSLSLHTILNLYSSKAFSSLFPQRKVLVATRSCCKSVLQAPLYKLITVPAHGHLSTRLIQTSISKSMLFFRISSQTFPSFIQEPLSIDGMKVFACPSAKQPF